VVASRLRGAAVAVWRGIRCVGRAVRTLHQEQVLMWELFWESSRVRVEREGPLAWTSSLDGPRLTGSRLPAADQAAADKAADETAAGDRL
jgi:hypothetical protein